MHFSSLHHYLWMGGYSAYVWPAYGIALGVFLIYAVVVHSKLRRLKNKLRNCKLRVLNGQ